MILGILSDTHDRSDAAAAAVKLLREHHAEYFIHCGDVGSAAVLDHLAGLRAAFVFGNNDWDKTTLRHYAQDIGVECFDHFGDLILDDKRIAVIHGDRPQLKRNVLQDQQHDYLLQGHTHMRSDEKFGRVRVINPGALYRASIKSVATLDLKKDLLVFHDVNL